MNKYCFSIILFTLLFHSVNAQISNQYNLRDVLKLARENHIGYQQLDIEQHVNNLEHQMFKNSFLPTISASLSAPSLNRSISSITQDDGSLKFRESNTASSSLSLNINQNIPLTGGTLSISNSLSRLDQLGDFPSSTYSSSWLGVSYSQPITKFNSFKSAKKTVPLKYNKLAYESHEKAERLNISIITLFFDCFILKRKLELAQEAHVNSQNYHAISKEKLELSRINNNQFIKVELLLLESEQRVKNSEFSYGLKMSELQSAITTNHNIGELNLVYPEKISIIDFIDSKEVMNLALKNYKEKRAYDQLSVDEQLRKVNSQKLSTSIRVGYGFNNSNELIENIYKNPQNRQSLNISFSKTILDWNISKHERKIALHNKQIIDLSVQNGIQQKKREIQSLLQRLNAVNMELDLNFRKHQLSKLNYQYSQEAYLVEKINLMELSSAKFKMEQSEIEYLESIKSSWITYYKIRKNTLFDFEKKQSLIPPF